jgi:hypothetical protein
MNKGRNRVTRTAVVIGAMALFLVSFTAQAGKSDLAWTGDRSALRALDRVSEWRSDPVNVPQLLLEDEANLGRTDIPYRVGYPMEVDISPSNAGTWEDLPDGSRLWRLKVATENAIWTVLGFDLFRLQYGAAMTVYDPDGKTVMGPYTAAHIRKHGELWFPPIAGDTLVVELYWPQKLRGVEPALHLGTVSHGYKSWGTIGIDQDPYGDGDIVGAGFGDSGSCNIDTPECPEAAGWEDPTRSVVMVLVGGSGNCSGSLLNSTAEDCAPLLLTAAHCGENGPGTTIGFNFVRTGCGTGQPVHSETTQTLTGGTLLADWGPSDATLIEMDEAPAEDWEVYFAGWSRDPNPAQFTYVISHPRGDVKKIAFDGDPPVDGFNWGPDHWRIDDSNPDPAHLAYEWGTTAPASSGSPLFDHNQRVIGQLHGGTASCTSDTYDEYGKVDVSWVGGGTPSTRLSDWLDPAGTGVMFVDGIDHQLCLYQPAGVILFTRDNYQCSDTLAVTLRDDNIPGAPATVDVLVSSATEVEPETLTLNQIEPGAGRYSAVIPTSTGPPVQGDGLVSVSHGDALTVNYIDADDGAGGFDVTVKDNADVDCLAPAITAVAVTQVNARDATLQVDTDEVTRATVRAGTVCGLVDATGESTTLATQHDVVVGGLLDETTYYATVEAQDDAGNASSDDNGGLCYSFTTPEVPDFFTEQFSAGLDLEGLSTTFTPNGSNDFYAHCTEPLEGGLPTDPTGGTDSGLGDDQPTSFDLAGGAIVSLYDQAYTTVFVGPNGFLTFTAGDSDYTESLTDHFDLPRVSAVFDDLNPGAGGSVSWKQLEDRVAVTWQDVPEYSTSNNNTFQIEMFFDGRIRMSWLRIDSGDAVVGLSAGNGVDPAFFPSDISSDAGCGPTPPQAYDLAAATSGDMSVGIDLEATDDGHPGPLVYRIESLPTWGTLTDDVTGHAIDAAPHVLAAGGRGLTYTPDLGYAGADAFTFVADDGGASPGGGSSNLATVDLNVGGPMAAAEFLVDDADPGWATTGSWAFGQPTGGGSHNGDPTSGYTGNNVYGYNLDGDYENSIVSETLTTTPIDLSGATNVQLEFQRWLGVDSGAFDQAYIMGSTDGVTWNVLWAHVGILPVSDSNWTLDTHDISALADRAGALQLRWVMGKTDATTTYPGWNIDDVRLVGDMSCADAPGEVDGLTLFDDRQTLRWDPPAASGGTTPYYDVLRSTDATDFVAATCLETDDGADTFAEDLDVPADNQVFYYLARAGNACGDGTLGPDRGGAVCTAP